MTDEPSSAGPVLKTELMTGAGTMRSSRAGTWSGRRAVDIRRLQRASPVGGPPRIERRGRGVGGREGADATRNGKGAARAGAGGASHAAQLAGAYPSAQWNSVRRRDPPCEGRNWVVFDPFRRFQLARRRRHAASPATAAANGSGPGSGTGAGANAMASRAGTDGPTSVTAPVAGSMVTRCVAGGVPGPLPLRPYRVVPSNASAPYAPPPAGNVGWPTFAYAP